MFAVVDRRVVPSAEENQVDEGGDAAVRPVDDVVGVAPRRRSRATGPRAAAVSQFECSSDRRGDGSDPAPDVEGLTLAVDDNPDDAGIACEASDRLRVDSRCVDLSESLFASGQGCVGDGTVMWGRSPPLMAVSSL